LDFPSGWEFRLLKGLGSFALVRAVLAGKTMEKTIIDESCRSCGRRDSCQSVYEALGRMKGPSVAWKVVFIFLAPLVVFACAAACLDEWLKNRILEPSIRTVAVFLLSAAMGGLASAVVWLAVPAWRKRGCSSGKVQDGCHEKKGL